jgi:hypothetical protein
MILPNEGSKWEHAKFYYRVTERAVIATMHVIESHLTHSQAVSTAAWQTLQKDHPLRALLKPYTLNTHSVNSAAYHMLVKADSVLTHASDFTSEGVIGAMTLFFRHYNFNQTIPDLLDSRGLDKVMNTGAIPLYSQSKRLYQVHRTFVERYVNHWYPTDEDLIQDGSVIRFWNHVNTFGRHLDPCVCGMSSEFFFDDNGVWPGFETTRTCDNLLNTVGFEPSKNQVTRRVDWCTSTDPFTKVKALYNMNQVICKYCVCGIVVLMMKRDVSTDLYFLSNYSQYR